MKTIAISQFRNNLPNFIEETAETLSIPGAIDKKISLLSSQPFVAKKLSGEYKDLRSLKVWHYRIIYVTDEI